jgi:hypothetical protein
MIKHIRSANGSSILPRVLRGRLSWRVERCERGEEFAAGGAGTLALYSGNQGTSSSLSCERGTVGISMKNVRACTINFEVTALKEGCSKSLEVLMSICIVARPATPISSRHRKRRSHVWVRCGSLRLLALALSVL